MAGLKPRDTVSPIVVLVWALVIIIIGLLIIQQQNDEFQALVSEKDKYTMDYVLAQQRRSEQDTEISRANTRDYITDVAREHGYQYPGDTFYKIVNPELLYDDYDPAQEGLK